MYTRPAKRKRVDVDDGDNDAPPAKRGPPEAVGLGHRDFSAIVPGASDAPEDVADMLAMMNNQHRFIDDALRELRAFVAPPEHAEALGDICALIEIANGALRRDVVAACAKPSAWLRIERLVEALLEPLAGATSALRELTFNVDRCEHNLHALVPVVLRLAKATRLYRSYYMTLRASWCMQSHDEKPPPHAGARQRKAQPSPPGIMAEAAQLYERLNNLCSILHAHIAPPQADFARSIVAHIHQVTNDVIPRLQSVVMDADLLAATQAQLCEPIQSLVRTARSGGAPNPSEAYALDSAIRHVTALHEHLDGLATMIVLPRAE